MEYRTQEVGNLIADALLGKGTKSTAKEGSPFDRERKMIIRGVISNIGEFHPVTRDRLDNFTLTPNDMYVIFKSGMDFTKKLQK